MILQSINVMRSKNTPKYKLLMELGNGDATKGRLLFDDKVVDLLRQVETIHFEMLESDKYPEFLDLLIKNKCYKNSQSARSSFAFIMTRTTTHSLRFNTYNTLTKAVELYEEFKTKTKGN